MSSSSSNRKKCEQTLDRVVGLLNEELLRNTIDHPLDRVDQAAARYEAVSRETPNVTALLCQAGKYIQDIYALGLRVPRDFSSRQAEAEAVQLLERCYQGVSGRGCTAAICDALSQEKEGLAYLRTFLLGAVKQEEREKHVRWVLQTNIEALNWEDRRAITAVLLERFHDLLPLDLANVRPERIADYLPELLLTCTTARAEVQKMVLGR